MAKKTALSLGFLLLLPTLALAQTQSPVNEPATNGGGGNVGVNVDLGQVFNLLGGNKTASMQMRDSDLPDFTPDSVVFLYDGDAAPASALAKRAGLTDIEADYLDSIGVTMISARSKTPDQAAAALAQNPGVIEAQREGVFQQMGRLSMPITHAKSAPPTAPAVRRAGQVRIAMIDGLIDIHHDNLKASWIKQVNFTGAEKDSAHGTAIASLIVGEGEVQGSAAGQQLHSFAAFLPAPGDAPGASRTRELAKALNAAAAINPHILNMSFGGPEDAVLTRILRKISAQGTCLIAATGNGGKTGKPPFPAKMSGVIGITAVDSKLKLYKYATLGKHVTAAAKGVKRLSAVPGGYRIASGTSFASADIAGQLAQLTLCNSQRGGASLASHIAKSAKDLGQSGFDEAYGYGLFQR